MGFYARRLLPRLLDFAMRKKDATTLRAEWIPRASGEVLELGIGSGLNLPFYAAGVERVRGVDPSAELREMAASRAAEAPFAVEFLAQSAEDRLPLPARSIDTAVITWTLCSIPRPALALAEVERLLKPEGRLIFIEHGRAPEPAVGRWQDRLTPLWKRIGGGCHLNRPIETLITSAGLRIAELRTGYLPGPRPMTYTYQGIARPVGPT